MKGDRIRRHQRQGIFLFYSGAPFKKMCTYYLPSSFFLSLSSFLLFFTYSADIFQVVHSVQYNETNMVLAFKILRV